MPDVVGAAPQPDVLQVPNNVYRKPENPLNSLRSKTVQGVQDMVVNGPRQNVAIPVAEELPQPAQRQVAVYNADSPQEATEGFESHDNEQVAPTPQPEIKGSPYARIRVLERERALERKRAEELQEQVALLAKVVDKAGIMQEEEYEEEEPTDPISRLERKQDATLKEINDFKESIKRDREASVERNITNAADSAIREFAAKAEGVKPGLYQEAMAHLANVKLSEILEDNDEISEEDAKIELAKWVVGIKDKAVRNGKNPGEELMRRSLLHGFQMPAPPTQSGKVPTQNGKENATEKIAKEKSRKDGLGSISTVQGSPANDPMKNLAGMSERDRVRAIMNSQKERGQLRRSAPLSELLAHKIRH